MKLDLEDFVAEGEKVLVRLMIRATHTGAFGALAATNGSRFRSLTFSTSAMAF
jgi:predicted ester cyclase